MYFIRRVFATCCCVLRTGISLCLCGVPECHDEWIRSSDFLIVQVEQFLLIESGASFLDLTDREVQHMFSHGFGDEF